MACLAKWSWSAPTFENSAGSRQASFGPGYGLGS